MKRSVLVLITVCVLACTASGCGILLVGTAAGSGTVMLVTGKLSEVVDLPAVQAAEVVKRVLAENQFPLVKEKQKDEVILLQARHSNGKLIRVDIHPLVDSSSRIEVRVGLITEEKPTQDLMEKILAAVNS